MEGGQREGGVVDFDVEVARGEGGVRGRRGGDPAAEVEGSLFLERLGPQGNSGRIIRRENPHLDEFTGDHVGHDFAEGNLAHPGARNPVPAEARRVRRWGGWNRSAAFPGSRSPKSLYFSKPPPTVART